MTLVYNLPLNFEILIWCKNGNQTGPYYLLAVENEMCCIQPFSGLTSFRSMFVKPYFQSENTCDIKLDELKIPTKLNKLDVPTELDKLEVPIKLNKLKVLIELDELEVPLGTY